VLVGCDYFVLEEITLRASLSDATAPASCEIISILSGTCEVRTPAGHALTLALGDTAVLPALLGAYTLQGERARLLRSYVPSPDDRLLALWHAAQ
jgi:mannose-6-phosphate isomerase class I